MESLAASRRGIAVSHSGSAQRSFDKSVCCRNQTDMEGGHGADTHWRASTQQLASYLCIHATYEAFWGSGPTFTISTLSQFEILGCKMARHCWLTDEHACKPTNRVPCWVPAIPTFWRLLTHDVLPVRACLPVCPAPASLSMQCSPLDTSSKGLVSWQPAQRANTSSVLGQLPPVRSVPLASPLPKRHLYQLLRAQVGSLLIWAWHPILLCTAKL